MAILTAFKLLLYYCGVIKTAGITAVFPREIVPVCTGDQIELACTIEGGFLRWSIIVMPDNETSTTYGRLVDNSEQMPENVVVNSTMLTFSRTSAPYSLPLMSNLSINRVTSMTNVTCTDISARSSSSTLLNVINSEDMVQEPQLVNFTIGIEKETDNGINTAITLQWNESIHQDLFDYHVVVVPNETLEVPTKFTKRLPIIVVEVLYNISYNVNVTATPRCGRPQNSTLLQIGLFYSNCGESGFSQNITNYLNPTVEGNTKSNHCSSGNVPITTTETSFEPLSRDGKIAVASSMTAFIVASTLFFIVGFLCGHFCRKERKNAEIVSQTRTPYYDDVVLQQHEQELELKENVAYGPV